MKRCRSCGRVPLDEYVGVRVTERDGKRVPGFSGVAHCGSVWSCPVCSARICEERARLVSEVARRAVAAGMRIVMVSLTVRHRQGQTAAELWDAVGACWNAAASGPGWAKDAAAYGAVTRGVTVRGGCEADGCFDVAGVRVTAEGSAGQLLCSRHAESRVASALECGVRVKTRRAAHGGNVEVTRKGWLPYLRVFDVTVGDNGWHPHVHALVFVDGATTDDGAWALGRSMWERWNAEAIRQGLDAGVGTKVRSDDGRWREPGFDAHIVRGDASGTEVGRYFSKAVYELVGSGYKTARGGSMTPFGVLAALMRHRAGMVCARPGDHSADCTCGTLTADEVKRFSAVWAEWETASSGRRQLGMSKGLLDWLGLDAAEWAREDEEIAEDELGTAADEVARISKRVWRFVTWQGFYLEVLAAFGESDERGRQLLAFIEGLADERWRDRPPDGFTT